MLASLIEHWQFDPEMLNVHCSMFHCHFPQPSQGWRPPFGIGGKCCGGPPGGGAAAGGAAGWRGATGGGATCGRGATTGGDTGGCGLAAAGGGVTFGATGAADLGINVGFCLSGGGATICGGAEGAVRVPEVSRNVGGAGGGAVL